MSGPFFSVIIPTYNRCDFLKTAVGSVLGQTFEDFELVIVDDGSTDGSGPFIESIKDPRIVYTAQEHSGISPARNRGVARSKGKAITFLDSDDRFVETKLEVTHDYMEKFPDFRIFHTEEIWYRNGELLPQKIHHKKPEGNAFGRALRLCCISISTAAVKREVFDETGLFDEDLPACEDYDFWLRATSRYPVKLIPEALTVKAGGHPDQLSKKYSGMDKFRIRSIKKLLDSDSLDESQRKKAAAELTRKCGIYLKGAEKRNKIKEIEYYNSLINFYNSGPYIKGKSDEI